MSKFKSSFFGGYKKAEVNAEITELNKKLADAEAENKRLLREAEYAESKAADLENKLSLLCANENTEKPLSETARKASEAGEKADNSEVFGNIAKIYKRAYGVGHEIVCDSRENALEMLNALNDRFDEIMGESAEIINKYEEINRDVQSIYVSLSHSISDISDTTSHMLNRAKEFYGIYGELKNGVAVAKESAADLLTKYENRTSEFYDVQSAPQTSEAAKENTDSSEVSATATEPTDAPQPPIILKPTNENSIGTEAVSETAPEEETDPVTAPLRVAVTHTDSEKPSNEFTQFGRKSKISAQDRNELLRKALLKNGGN